MMRVMRSCRMLLLVFCCFLWTLPACQQDKPKTDGPAPDPVQTKELPAEAVATGEADAKAAEVETEEPPGPEASSPEQNIQHVLISLLPPKLQELFLLGVEPAKQDMSKLGFRLQKALVTGQLKPIVEGLWNLLMNLRDKRCIEYMMLDGADCGCDRLLDGVRCSHPHIFPPRFSSCEIVKQGENLPSLALCQSDDKDFFRLAYAWQNTLVVRDWPPEMLDRMENMDNENHKLCTSRNAIHECEVECNPLAETYDECQEGCMEGWARMHGGDLSEQEVEVTGKEEEFDEEKVDRCQKNCRSNEPSTNAEYHDWIEIMEVQMSEPGVFELKVRTAQGLVDEEEQDDGGYKSICLPVQRGEVVLRDPLLKGAKQSLDAGLANKQGVWISDLEEVSNTVERAEEFDHCSHSGDFPVRLTRKPDEKQIQTQLMDVLLSNQVKIEAICKNIPEPLAEMMWNWLDRSLSKQSSHELFKHAIEAQDTVQLASLLTGIEVRLGKIPQDLILQYIAEESKEENVDVHENMEPNELCPDLEKDSFACKIVSNPRVLVCQASGDQLMDQSSSGEAWLVGVDQDGFPVVTDWLKSDHLDQLVPADQVQQWIDRLLESGANEFAQVYDGKEKVRELLEEACDQDSAEDCKKLGTMWFKGEGGPKDVVKARAFFKRACDAGFVEGCRMLGVMWSSGKGGPQDRTKARMIFKKACDADYAKACDHLGLMWAKGRGGGQDGKMARALFKQSCEGGYAVGCFNLGVMCLQGNGGSQDKVKARTLFKKACDGDHANACRKLGSMWYKGEGGPTDKAKARKYLEKSVTVHPSVVPHRPASRIGPSGKEEVRSGATLWS